MTALRFLLGFIAGAFTLKSTRILRMASDISQFSLSDTLFAVNDTITEQDAPRYNSADDRPANIAVREAGNIASVIDTTAATKSASSEGNDEIDSHQGKEEAVTTSSDASDAMHLKGGNSSIQDFVRHPGVVIAFRIHGPNDIPKLQQALCLLHAAYNHRMLYDIVVFSAVSIDKQVHFLQQIVHPAAMLIYEDRKSLRDQTKELTEFQKEDLIKRCEGVNVTKYWPVLEWETICTSATANGKHKKVPLSESWISEFRTTWIWNYGYVSKYKYMMWMDIDSSPMQAWKQDPVAYMIRNDLVLLMDHYQTDYADGTSGLHDKIVGAYNQTVCSSSIGEDGRLTATYGKTCSEKVSLVKGFFHLTKLDHYRDQRPLLGKIVGDQRFMGNDQLAVTLPAVMTAPGRTVEMSKVGINLKVMHKGKIDGKQQWKGGEGYSKYWATEAAVRFPEAYEVCKPFVKM